MYALTEPMLMIRPPPCARITGKTAHKQPYDPERAKKLLAESGLRRSTPPTLLVADGALMQVDTGNAFHGGADPLRRADR